VEDAKRALFLYGNDTSKTVKEVLTDLHKIKGVSNSQHPAIYISGMKQQTISQQHLQDSRLPCCHRFGTAAPAEAIHHCLGLVLCLTHPQCGAIS
jgi:hypothetical protein